MDMSKPEDRRLARNRSLRVALITSVAARISGVLLQVISLPIAAIHLGAAGFSIYAMFTSLLAVMTLSNFGIGQATTLHMSNKLAVGEESTGRELFLASLGLAFGIATVVTTIAVILIVLTPLLPLLFAQHLDQTAMPIGSALFVCFIFYIVQLLSVFEAAQLAQQRQHRLNIVLGVGTFFAALTVWLVANTSPNVLYILLAVHLPIILVRAINAVVVWIDISPRSEDLKRALIHMRDVFKDGLSFVSGTTITNFLCHPFSILVVGLFSAPLTTASFAAVMNAIILSLSAVSLLVLPFRGAMPEAYRSEDHAWLHKTLTLLFGASAACGSIVFLVFAITGERLFDLWYGGTIVPQRTELLAAGLYFFALAIEQTNFTFLSSTGRLAKASRAILIKGLLSALIVLLVIYLGYNFLVFWVLFVCNVLFSLFPLSAMTIAALKRETLNDH